MIEAYSMIMTYFYMGLFLFSVLMGLFAVWNRIRKRRFKYWWLVPCLAVYSLVALCNTFVAYLAYDDISHPNYGRYAHWGLCNFILNDAGMLAAWLLVGAGLFYLVKRKEGKKPIKGGGKSALVLLLALLVMLLFVGILTVTKFSAIELDGRKVDLERDRYGDVRISV